MRNDIASRAAFAFTPLSLRSLALGLIAALIVSLAAPAAFARDDDSYKGPSTGGGLDDQLREMEPARRHLLQPLRDCAAAMPRRPQRAAADCAVA